MTTRDYETALGAIDRDIAALELVGKLSRLLANHVKRQDAEMAELRDEIVALSNRLEAVTRTVGGGLHSVKV